MANGVKNIELPKEEQFEEIHTKFYAYNGKDPYLFISYSHRDTKVVYPILDALYDEKFRIWYDESCENGNDFREELRDRIKKCEAVVLFVSKASMESPFCGMEIIVAKENGKRLFPIFIEDVVVPPAFSILLANTHHSTLSSNMKKVIEDLVRDLPPEAMDRVVVNEEKTVIEKCKDNGDVIILEEGITEISSEAFKECRALKKIELPSTLTKIGRESFRGCGNLRSMDIPAATDRIGESAFRDCVRIKSLLVRNNKVKIGERAFENCASLSDVILPNDLTEIYGGVFNSCKSLKSIVLPEALTIIGESAFSDCVGLEEMDIPDNVTKIDDLVFNGCENLKKIKLNEGLKKIGKGAFKNCSSLIEITIPSTVTNISDAPFRGCESLKSIKAEPKNKYYKSEPNKRDGSDHVLFNKNKSTLIAYPASSREVQYDIPDSVTVISERAFSECKKLNRITIPDSVNEIGEGAFCNCALLDEVEIPDSVTKIDDCAFKGCTSLEKVVIPSSVKELGWGLFDDNEKQVVVYCEEGSAVYEYCKDKIRTADISEKDND